MKEVINKYNGNLLNLDNNLINLTIIESNIKKIIFPPNLYEIHIFNSSIEQYDTFPKSLITLRIIDSFILNLEELPFLPLLNELHLTENIKINNLGNNIKYLLLENFNVDYKIIWPIKLEHLTLNSTNILLDNLPNINKLKINIQNHKETININITKLSSLTIVNIKETDTIIINSKIDKFIMRNSNYNNLDFLSNCDIKEIIIYNSNFNNINNLPKKLKKFEFYHNNEDFPNKTYIINFPKKINYIEICDCYLDTNLINYKYLNYFYTNCATIDLLQKLPITIKTIDIGYSPLTIQMINNSNLDTKIKKLIQIKN
jgi:hypothetical protein